MRIGIVGLGTVGKAIQECFKGSHEIFVHDLSLGTEIENVVENTKIAYLAVPTPTDENSGKCDTSIVESVIEELPEGFSVVIKSTVIPGTTQRLHEKFPRLKIACSPEFLRNNNAIEDFRSQESVVLGTHHKDLAELVRMHHEESGILKEGHFFHVSPTQAEISKYAKNSFYAMKVIFGNQFQLLSRHFGEDWEDIKAIITHSQNRSIVDSHLDENPRGMGFGGHCLPKDVRAIYTELEEFGLDLELLGAIMNDNNNLRS